MSGVLVGDATDASDSVISVSELRVEYTGSRQLPWRPPRTVSALNGVSLAVGSAHAVGLVGESGCGKSTLGRVMVGLQRPSSGVAAYRGQPIDTLDGRAHRTFRRDVQMVFQDPYSTLDPRMRVGDSIAEPIHALGTPAERADWRGRVSELLDLVGLLPEHANRFPHQFSGGQRQRIGIARAVALGPKVVVLDEPVSALDVSLQAQVLELLARLRRELGLGFVLISHDLAVVRLICDVVAVMYMGRIVEWGPVETVYSNPQHPYTNLLLSSVPIPDPSARDRRKQQRIVPLGEPPNPLSLPSGCHFRTRCPNADGQCAEVAPPLTAGAGRAHALACFHPVGESRLSRTSGGGETRRST